MHSNGFEVFVQTLVLLITHVTFHFCYKSIFKFCFFNGTIGVISIFRKTLFRVQSFPLFQLSPLILELFAFLFLLWEPISKTGNSMTTTTRAWITITSEIRPLFVPRCYVKNFSLLFISHPIRRPPSSKSKLYSIHIYQPLMLAALHVSGREQQVAQCGCHAICCRSIIWQGAS